VCDFYYTKDCVYEEKAKLRNFTSDLYENKSKEGYRFSLHVRFPLFVVYNY